MIGTQDLMVFLAIGLFFFGAKKLPELSRSLGQALTEFKKGVNSPPEDAAPPKPAAAAASAAPAGPEGEAAREPAPPRT